MNNRITAGRANTCEHNEAVELQMRLFHEMAQRARSGYILQRARKLALGHIPHGTHTHTKAFELDVRVYHNSYSAGGIGIKTTRKFPPKYRHSHAFMLKCSRSLTMCSLLTCDGFNTALCERERAHWMLCAEFASGASCARQFVGVRQRTRSVGRRVFGAGKSRARITYRAYQQRGYVSGAISACVLKYIGNLWQNCLTSIGHRRHRATPAHPHNPHNPRRKTN